MTKLYIITILCVSIASHAQLSENFDASTSLPAGWTTMIGANGLGTGFNWTTSPLRYASANNSAFVRYEAGTGGTTQDWLVTPIIDLTNYSDNVLTFSGGEQYTAVYASVYSVRVSTTSATDIASFTTIATYSEVDFSGIVEGAVLLASDLKTVDLVNYEGEQIYIAFVLEQNDDDNWFIDDVNVTGTLSIGEFEENKVSVYPNPTTGILNISSESTLSSIEIYNVLGSRIKIVKNSNKVDLSDLSAGTYIAKMTTANGFVKNQKVIKN